MSAPSLLQSHRLKSSRWCWLCLTSSACLTVCRRGYSRRATTCLRRSCAGCSVGPSTTALCRRLYKSAYITPLLKKADLDSSDPKSYRSISNLSVLSKLLERLVSKQLVTYRLKMICSQISSQLIGVITNEDCRSQGPVRYLTSTGLWPAGITITFTLVSCL